MNVEFPAWASDYVRPSRYKVAYGGRGSGKSWVFARLLLLEAAKRPTRVLCARELQVSIRDSVHRLLVDQIEMMGLGTYFESGESYLRGRNGTEFLFKGLRHNADEIKSTEGVEICWVEEAQAVSEASWRLLLPTIRDSGSEIWITFNPSKTTDPTFKRFVTNSPPNAIVKKVNWTENPWFPQELEDERTHMLATDYDAYRNVWEGECTTRSDAQVLNGKWTVEAFEADPTKWNGPYYGVDWGFSQDPTVMVRCWVHEDRLYIDYEAHGVAVPLDKTASLFKQVPEASKHVVRADSARPETINYLQSRGFPRLAPVNKWPGSVEDGVERLRAFHRIVIHPRCKLTANEAMLWSYAVDRQTGDVMTKLVDADNHSWDAIRYALEPIIRRARQAPAAAVARTFQ